MMFGLHHEILPPSGVEFATSLKLTPSTLSIHGNSTIRHEFAARSVCNVVVARSNLLRIFEVRLELPPISFQAEEERERGANIRKGTEAVEGEVEMDIQGDGFINIDKNPQSLGQKISIPTVTKFHFVREHRLHGIVTGMEAIKVMASIDDKLDRLLVSFKDAKIALLEWSDTIHDLVTVSIHTYERAPQLMSMDSMAFRSELRVDPLSRCAALSLPQDAIAVLPFYQTQAEIDEQETQLARDIPYSPSFILDMPTSVDKNIHNVIDFVFLPGFNNPTIAVLFQTQLTWTGRLKEFKDTVKLVVFTLNFRSQTFPIITSVDGLPHDCISLLACGASLGGVVVFTSNAIIYVDQSSRRVPLPLNGWTSRISDMPLPAPTQQSLCLHLEGSRSIFVDDKTIFLILKDGTVYPIEFVAEGKLVSKLVMTSALAQTAIPAVLRKLDDSLLFVGSTGGPSVLLKAARVEQEIDEDEVMSPVPAVVQLDTMDLDDDDEDIYGPSKVTEAVTGQTNGISGKKTRSVIQLSLCDSLSGYGPIADMTFSVAKNGDRPVPELVTATGCGALGGFTLFQRDLPIHTKRKLHAISGARGLWSLPIRQPIKGSGGVSFERPANLFYGENDTLLISTDAIPSPGLSRISARSAKTDITINARIPGTTIGAGAFFQRTAILHVMTNAIRLLEPDGSERQVIKDVDPSNTPRAKIRYCCIADPFVLIFREDDTIGLFTAVIDKGRIRRKDMSPMGDKNSRYLTGCFFTDTNGLFESHLDSLAVPNSAVSADKDGSTLQNAVNSGNQTQWLLLVRPQGVLEIWTLPKMTLAFSTTGFCTLQPIITDSHDAVVLSLPQDPPRRPQELDIEHILVAPVGQTDPQPYLFLLLRSGHFCIYQILPIESPIIELGTSPRSTSLKLKFVKVVSKTYEIQRLEEEKSAILAEQKRILRGFVPFVTTLLSGESFSGVFFTGENPSWIVKADQGPVQVYPSGHSVVHAFTPCSLWESKSDFLIYSDEGPTLLEWIPSFSYEYPLPSKSIPRGRAYTNLAFDPSTNLVVAAGLVQAKFASYDEDGNSLWEPDAKNVDYPMCDCSTLELISTEGWVTMDGFEFATNEFVNSISIVTLETSSTESGNKDFVAVGTTVSRGEDLAAKGATYIFEIVEVVSDPKAIPKRWWKLRLRCRDEAKGPVTAVCGFDGYVVSSMGQKVFVKAFDLDERLVGVAFLDVGVYVTSLRTLKNLLLVTDAVKSLFFVAFQEDPYKLVILARDVNHLPVSTTRGDFFFKDEEMAIATCDEEGVLRLYEYAPQDPESNDGRHLLLRTEFQCQAEYRTSVAIARRTKETPDLPQSKLLYGSVNGSLAGITPVEEATAKRLQLLQGQLTRNIQHVAGLNPKAFRIVRNDYISKPLSKEMLDGNLLEQFEGLTTIRQAEMTKQIGTDREIVLKDWLGLVGPW